MKKHLILAAVAAFSFLSASAQSGTNSPYSQYGLGVLADQSQGFNRGMNGVGLSLRKGNAVNVLNPASYSGIDSLTMIFDVGLSGQITNFKEGATKVNAKNADFEYAVGSFRLLPNVGIGFGIIPYSNLGYEYFSNVKLKDAFGTVMETASYDYEGDGGLHQVFIGAGWKVAKPLSIGLNVAYLWGTMDRSITSSSSSSSVNTLMKGYYSNINSYLLTAGFQWEQRLNREDVLTLGATIGLGHKLGADANCMILNTNNMTSMVDTTTFVVSNAYEIPMSYSVGLGWTHGDRLFVGADFNLQKWGSLDYPDYSNGTYALRSGLLKDRYKVNVGADFVPNPMSRTFVHRVHYRMGVGYATPYYYIGGQDGPKELSVSAGFGIPLQNGWNNRSILNISAQWARSSAQNLLTENTFRINIGLTFNERWFAKWKVD